MKKISLNMQDIRTAVKTIKTAILKSRYMAARQANVEHLKLYFRVGAYVSANSRNGTWGTGAIAAISEKLSIELPGLRGFSPTNMKNMRIFFEQWAFDENRQLPTDDLKNYLADEPLPAIRQLSTGELTESDIAAFFSIGFTHHMEIGLILCHSMDRPVVELAVRRYAMPMGVATYRTSKDVPPAYKALKPLLDGSQKLLEELNSETPASIRKATSERREYEKPPRKARVGAAK